MTTATLDAPAKLSFAELCAKRAPLIADGSLLVCEAVDELQAVAEHSGLIAAIGQDAVQDMLSGAIATAHLAPELDADALAGLDEAMEIEIALRTAEMVRDWELADPRDRWRHTGERAPIMRPVVRRRSPYAPPQSTVDAFLFVAALDDVARLKAWLADHSRDAPILLKLLESKVC